MSEATTTEATTETAGETSADTSTEATTATETAAEQVDWQSKFEAQQRITRDLEKKVKGEAGNLRGQLDALQAKLDGKEAEHAAEQVKRETERAALDKANDRIRRAEVKAAAKGVLADPADAYKFLDLDSFEVSDDGDVDADAISAALAELVKSKSYLAVQDGKRFQGDADSGTRKEARPAQLSDSDLERMSPEQIDTARKEGRLNDLLGVKP